MKLIKLIQRLVLPQVTRLDLVQGWYCLRSCPQVPCYRSWYHLQACMPDQHCWSLVFFSGSLGKRRTYDLCKLLEMAGHCSPLPTTTTTGMCPHKPWFKLTLCMVHSARYIGKPGVCRCVPGRIYLITQPTLFGVQGQGIPWERSRIICWPCCNLQQRVNYAEFKSSINPNRSLLRASPTVMGMWSCTVKLDEENPTYAGLAQENGFGSA